MKSLIFIAEKCDGLIKARTCANGSTQQSCAPKDDAVSPTVLLESILITAAIKAKDMMQ